MEGLTQCPNQETLESPPIFKALVQAHRHLAELKGMAPTLPNDKILLANITLKEAKNSSAIENIITTQDSLYKYQIQENLKGHEKEVHNYSQALNVGWERVRENNGISLNTILEIQKLIEPKRPGFRKVSGTILRNEATGEVIYTPPSPEKIPELMNQFEALIHMNSMDPLIKVSVIHHYFESIHPFYDGNGRTGRIINILYLILNNLLDSPILYLSRYILRHKKNYYKYLQEVRTQESWTQWIVYMLEAISATSQEAKSLIKGIDELIREYKRIIRKNHRFYSHDLINNIFSHPYTKAKFLEKAMSVSRPTASRYLEALAQNNILEKNKIGKEVYYINKRLFDLLQDS